MVKLNDGQEKKLKITVNIEPADKATLADIAAEEINAGHESNEGIVSRRILHAACEEYRKKKASTT